MISRIAFKGAQICATFRLSSGPHKTISRGLWTCRVQFFRFTRGKTWTAGIGQESDCACTGREIVEGLNMLRCSIDIRCIANWSGGTMWRSGYENSLRKIGRSSMSVLSSMSSKRRSTSWSASSWSMAARRWRSGFTLGTPMLSQCHETRVRATGATSVMRKCHSTKWSVLRTMDHFNQGLVPIPHADKVEFQPATDFWTREVVEDRFPRTRRR